MVITTQADGQESQQKKELAHVMSLIFQTDYMLCLDAQKPNTFLVNIEKCFCIKTEHIRSEYRKVFLYINLSRLITTMSSVC